MGRLPAMASALIYLKGRAMYIIQGMLLLADCQYKNGQIHNLRRKLCSILKHLWQADMNPLAVRAMKFHSAYIDNGAVFIYGKRGEQDCQLKISWQNGKIICESNSDFTEFETKNIMKVLKYKLPANIGIEKIQAYGNRMEYHTLKFNQDNILLWNNLTKGIAHKPLRDPVEIKRRSALRVEYNSRNGTTVIAGIENI